MQNDLAALYKLTPAELKTLKGLLLAPKTKINSQTYGYDGVTYLLLKELNYDVPTLIRILNSDFKNKKRVFTSSYRIKLLTIIKEAIALTEIELSREDDGFVSLNDIAKQRRLVLLGIDRNMLNRTVKKYNINYTKRRT